MNKFIKELIEKYPELAACAEDIQNTCQLMQTAFTEGGKLLVCGNGGSAADSEHIVGELMKGFVKKRPLPADIRNRIIAQYPEQGEYLTVGLQGALPAIALTSNTTLLTAYSNDVAADMAFAQQVYGYGNPGDVLLGLSTSGNAVNVIHALQIARVLGLKTVGLTGAGGGSMKEHCDVVIGVPFEVTAAVQERHLPIYHCLCMVLEDTFFKE